MKLLQLFRRTPKAPELSPLVATLITVLRDPTFSWGSEEHTISCRALPWRIWTANDVFNCGLYPGPKEALPLNERKLLWDEAWAAVARTIEKEAEAVRAKKVADKLNPPEEKFLGIMVPPGQIQQWPSSLQGKLSA